MPYTKLNQAIRKALDAHDGHWRKGEHGLPYIVHPIDVLIRVRHLAKVTDEDVLCAAILHDVVEDTDISPEELEAEFGPVTRRLVEQLSRRWVHPDTPDKWQIESEMLLEDLARMEPNAQRIKLCDRLSNLMESVRTQSPEKTQRYAEEALRMLDLVPRDIAPELWDLLSDFSSKAARGEKP